MKTLTAEAVRRAEDYILRSARVLERRRFDFLFGTGDGASVATALLPYRNEDGGFGHALEPDGRGPGSQPASVLFALSTLDEAGELGLVSGICDYLQAISAPDGGLPFVHPNIRDFPRAPWWQIPEVYEGSMFPTGCIAGLLHKNKVDHPWLAPATEFCWRVIDGLAGTNPYEAFGCIRFLDHVPDRDRAEAAVARLGKLVRDGQHVSVVGKDGEQHYPYDYAPTPESLARQWFTDEEIESTVDFLVESQQDDGSWMLNWTVWNPVIVYEWGGSITINALNTLRAYGRLGQ